MRETPMRYTATLIGAGEMAPRFDAFLDSVVDGVVEGDESTSIASLTYDVFAWTRAGARRRAAKVAAPVIGAASALGDHLRLFVERS